MNFNNRVIWKLSENVWITETIFNTWVIMAFLIAFAIIVRIMLSRFKEVPTGFQNFIELIIESMSNFVDSTMGEKYSYFANWFFGLFAFLLCCNLSGLVGLRPPTADLATTASCGITTFFLIHFMGIYKNGLGYFKGYIEPMPVFLPINIMGELATPISLSFRLFGNLLGGLIIMGMVYELFPIFLKLGVPAVFHIYFDVFSGCLQAFIFSILSMTFIREKIPE